METKFIKRHKDSNTFIIERSSFFDTPVHLNGNLIIGDNTDFWSDLVVTGSLELRKYVTVKGSVRAASAIIGAHSMIDGGVKTEQDCTVLDHATIGGNIAAGGDVMLRPNIRAGIVDAAGNIEVTGRAYVKELRAEQKIIARKDIL
uniref:Polymer-forming cytoskeletal protein n=1 Tax=Candidatus Methanogaster sp. ANME-2c ERB4 TaxID=2759911 RepID=A0A7G9YQL1_9EURY|nr:hypothetical protein FNHHLANA_00003 [Methanosarcinales archaeon ANME-2c ERB4]QNO50295.1 hypothetical protein AHGKLJGF_00030 [Methanosarcinales archaeon ANME-2c ERB4]